MPDFGRPHPLLAPTSELASYWKQQQLAPGQELGPDGERRLTDLIECVVELGTFFYHHEDEPELFSTFVGFLNQKGINSVRVEDFKLTKSAADALTPLLHEKPEVLREAIAHLKARWPEPPAQESGESGGAW